MQQNQGRQGYFCRPFLLNQGKSIRLCCAELPDLSRLHSGDFAENNLTNPTKSTRLLATFNQAFIKKIVRNFFSSKFYRII